MKILGCFKVVPDLDMVVDEDWAADDNLRIDTSYVKPLWNCFDESGLEMMLKLSDLSEGFNVVYELNALTVGKRQHESFLKILYALGYHKATRIELEEDLCFGPEKVAKAVAAYVDNIASQDVIIMGVQSSDGSNMKTPYLVAEQLGWPCITQVIALAPVDEEHLQVSSQTEAGTLVQVVKVPCVLAIGNAPSSYLRVPSLKDKMRLGKQPIEQISPEQVGMMEVKEQIELIGLSPVEKERDTIVIEGDTPRAKAQELYHTYLKGRLEKL